MERKKVFITFGGPSENYHRDVNRICDEMKEFNWFDEIKGYTEEDLKQDSFFWNKHGSFIESNPRGYGYWIWKPYLIQKKLNELNYEDILIYVDSGCYGNIKGKQRLLEYIDILDNDINKYGIISFTLDDNTNQNKLTNNKIFYNISENNWTKKKIFDELDCNYDNIKQSGQCMGGVQIIKKNDHSIHIINKWVENMKYHLINDNTENEEPCFIENRHDQSIYSCLVKKYGSIKIYSVGEFDFPELWHTQDWYSYPILHKGFSVNCPV